ncbi:uncharacterized protein CLUP02_00796 [Colletotrichum lupini]|uniref:Uncharacterized protein n=1 Tax=Colletotrichum lupini TaxID=145971 RepID=A0A9Q8SBS1_9PEZI|nr:uncharacterized protein CLUP02_00796 [Colletotrichum lupini]UQC74148.1 hypothetical protein CLUP02_00796 [Colletotrichum lupini]
MLFSADPGQFVTELTLWQTGEALSTTGMVTSSTLQPRSPPKKKKKLPGAEKPKNCRGESWAGSIRDIHSDIRHIPSSFPVTTSSEEPRRGGGKGLLLGTWKKWPMGEPTAERRMDQEAPFSPLAYAGTGGKCCRNRHHGATLETPGAKDTSLDTTSSLVPVSGCKKLMHALAGEEGTGGSRCRVAECNMKALTFRSGLLLQKNPSLFASNTKSLFSNIVIIALAPAPSPPSGDVPNYQCQSTRARLSPDIAARESPFVVSPALTWPSMRSLGANDTDEALRLNGPSWHGEWLQWAGRTLRRLFVSHPAAPTSRLGQPEGLMPLSWGNRPNPSRLLRIRVSTIRPALLTRFTTLGWPHVVVMDRQGKSTAHQVQTLSAGDGVASGDSTTVRQRQTREGQQSGQARPQGAGCETLSEMSFRRHGAHVQRIPSIRAPFHSNTTPILALYFHIADEASGQSSGSSKASRATLRHAEARASECHRLHDPGLPCRPLSSIRAVNTVLDAQIIRTHWQSARLTASSEAEADFHSTRLRAPARASSAPLTDLEGRPVSERIAFIRCQSLLRLNCLMRDDKRKEDPFLILESGAFLPDICLTVLPAGLVHSCSYACPPTCNGVGSAAVVDIYSSQLKDGGVSIRN